MEGAQRARRLAPDLVGQQQGPASRPSTARNTLELPSRRARRISPSAQGGTASGQTQASPPSRTQAATDAAFDAGTGGLFTLLRA